MNMRNLKIGRSGYGGAFAVLLLLGVSAQPANANSHYDSNSLNGNLQNQCTSFNGVINNTGFTVSAECNKATVTESVDATRQETSIDLSDDVVWNTTSQEFSWDVTRDKNNDVTQKCTAVLGFEYSSSDVTINLTCTIDSTDGRVQQTNTSLTLNGNLTVGSDGNLARR